MILELERIDAFYGIGMGDIKAINTETVARSCEEVMKARAGG